jgi:hypothetical protein
MRNKDTIILENLYTNIYNEMAYGMGAGGRPMSTQEIIEFIVHKNQTQGNKEIQISYTSITTPKLLKRQMPPDVETLYKVTQTVGRLGNYEKIVNREREKAGEEPDFKAQSNSRLKERLSQNIGITTTDKPVLLLDLTWLKSGTSIFVVKSKDGQLHEASREEIQGYIAPSSGGPPQTGQANFRSIGLDNIVGFRIENQEIVNSTMPEDRIEVFNFVKDKLKS